MPGFDRSGPMGTGPMTGGGRGWCRRAVGAVHPPVYGSGYGYGRGMGFRRGFGRAYGRSAGPAFGGYAYPPITGMAGPLSTTDELAMLQANADAMRTSLESIQRRIAELENPTDE